MDEEGIRTRIYYVKDRSRGLKLEMRGERLLEYRLGGITLIYTQQQGSTEHVIRLPVLIEPHILLVPNNPQFINNAGIFLEDFK